MAKKVVATLQTGSGKEFAKVIRMTKSSKSGSYSISETMVPNDKVQEFLSKR